MRAPLPSRSSAQIRPPCASTRPRAIARPRPGAASRARSISAPEALEHARTCLGVETLAGVLDGDPYFSCERLDPNRDRAVAGGVSQRVGEQVHEHALDLLGRETGGQLFVDVAGELTWRCRASASTPRRLLETHGSDGKLLCSSSVSASASMRASSKRSSTSCESTPTCSRSAGNVLLRLCEPVLERLEHRLHVDASGVRRSWLAQATSSRRESNSRCRFVAHLVEGAGELGNLDGPVRRRPGVEASALRALPTAARTRSTASAIEPCDHERQPRPRSTPTPP